MTIFARSLLPTSRYFQVATGVTVTGMPFSAPFPDGSSMNVGGDRMFVFTPGESLAIAIRVPGLPWPQPCGIDTTPGLIAPVTSTGTSICPPVEATVTKSPVATPRLVASSSCISSVQRSLPFIKGETLCSHELFDRKCRRLTSTSSSGARSRRPASRGRSSSRYCGARRILPSAVPRISGTCDTIGILAVAVSERSGAQREVEDALGSTCQTNRVIVLADGRAIETLGVRHVVEEAVVDGRDVDVLGGRAGAQTGQPDQDFPRLGPVPVLRREHRRRVVRDAVDREVEDQVVVVRLLERRRRRQDHVGMPGGFVEPQVD